jgi:hypothetical protein
LSFEWSLQLLDIVAFVSFNEFKFYVCESCKLSKHILLKFYSAFKLLNDHILSWQGCHSFTLFLAQYHSNDLLFLWWGRCVDKQIITQLQGKETGAREHGELIKGRVVPYREHWRTTADAKVLCPVWEKALHRSFQTKSSLYGNRSQFLKGHLRAVVLYEMAGGSRMLPLKTQSADSYSRPVSNWPFLFCSSALTDGNAVSWIHHLDHGNLSRNSCLGLAFVGTRNSFHV